MDADRFDAVSRAVSDAASRRTLLGLAVATVLGGQGIASVEAKKKKPCPPCKKRKKGKCKGLLPDGTTCDGGACQGGICVASPPPPQCTPNCNDRTCGADGCGGSCGACTGGAFCQGGNCVCPAGTVSCSGVCANLQTDEAHCGACGTSCAASQVCQAGKCFPRGVCIEGAGVCTSNIQCQAAGQSVCYCSTSTEGNAVCVENEGFCLDRTSCTSSTDCSGGEACVDVSGCCSGAPLPPGSKNCLAPCAHP